MDALEFLKERKRLCEVYFEKAECKECPLENMGCWTADFCADDSCEKVIAAVEQWSKEHPRKTRQSVFLEQCPDAIISDDKLPEVAPCQLCAGLIHGGSVEDCENRGLCVECRREFWMQEVE